MTRPPLPHPALASEHINLAEMTVHAQWAGYESRLALGFGHRLPLPMRLRMLSLLSGCLRMERHAHYRTDLAILALRRRWAIASAAVQSHSTQDDR